MGVICGVAGGTCGLQAYVEGYRVTWRVAGLFGGLQGLPVGLQGLTSTTIRGGSLLCKHSCSQSRSGCHDSGVHLHAEHQSKTQQLVVGDSAAVLLSLL